MAWHRSTEHHRDREMRLKVSIVTSVETSRFDLVAMLDSMLVTSIEDLNVRKDIHTNFTRSWQPKPKRSEEQRITNF